MKQYIRFGELPRSGKSTIFFRGEPVGEEEGVSVWDCKQDGDKYIPLLPDVPNEDAKDDLFRMLNYTYMYGNVYLVTGREVGRGQDGEPLIANAEIVRELSIEEIKKT